MKGRRQFTYHNEMVNSYSGQSRIIDAETIIRCKQALWKVRVGRHEPLRVISGSEDRAGGKLEI